MGDLSPHFSRAEFRCGGFGHPGHKDHPTIVAADLINVLENLRHILGRPLHIISGHRCEWWQERIHPGVVGYHPRGLAADIARGLFREDDARRAHAHGIGLRHGWVVHVDARPSTRVIVFPD